MTELCHVGRQKALLAEDKDGLSPGIEKTAAPVQKTAGVQVACRQAQLMSI